MAKKTYVEPVDYFPKSIRKEFKLGEFNDDVKKPEGKKKEEKKK